MLIGICGGIGSGKSVVSRILRLKGLPVYDCDSEAKRLMAYDRNIKMKIRDEISRDVTDGESIPDRALLAEIVFNDEESRSRLNAIVHEAVRKDVAMRYAAEENLWVEAAILAESGLGELCDRIWKVETPLNVRIRNIVGRDNSTVENALKRIRSQQREQELLSNYESITDIIVNDSGSSILQRIDELLENVVSTKKEN